MGKSGRWSRTTYTSAAHRVTLRPSFKQCAGSLVLRLAQHKVLYRRSALVARTRWAHAMSAPLTSLQCWPMKKEADLKRGRCCAELVDVRDG